MDSKSLMIGDWVRFASKYGYGTGQVVGIEPREGSAEPTTFTILEKDKEGNTKFFVGVSKNCVEPISLTAAILEKNGFIKRRSYSDYRWYLDGNNAVTLNIYSESNKIWRMSIDTNRNENTIVYVTFVHQLQNALRLCGIEKEIEL